MILSAIKIAIEFERLAVQFKVFGVDQEEWETVVKACKEKSKTTILSFDELMRFYLSDKAKFGRINLHQWILNY